MTEWLKTINFDDVDLAMIAVMVIVAMMFFIPTGWKEQVSMAIAGILALARGKPNGTI